MYIWPIYEGSSEKTLSVQSNESGILSIMINPLRTSHAIALFFTALVWVILLIFGALFGKILHSDFVKQLEVKTVEEVSSMASVEEIRDSFENVVIRNPDGSHFCRKWIFADLPDIPEHNQVLRHKKEEYLITTVTLDTWEEVCNAQKLTNVRTQLQIWFSRYIYISIFLLIVSYGLGLIFSHMLLWNIRKINAFSSKFIPGKTNKRIELSWVTNNPNDEIRILTNTLNSLFDRVNNHEKQLSQFSSDVAHEFKNALFEMRSSAQLSIKKWSKCECCETYTKRIGNLNELIDSLLFLAQIEHESICHTPKDIQNSLHDLIEQHFESSKTRIRLTTTSSVHKVHTWLFDIAIKNLIGNALKFSDSDKNIHVTLTEDSLTISDTWIGISSDDIKNIWDRFYKSDNQRSHGSGHGLGLAITKEIIENVHGWSIQTRSTLWKGATFIIQM